MSAEPVSGQQAYAAWAQAQRELHPGSRRGGHGRAGLSEASTEAYQSIWKGWLDWLADKHLDWREVSAADIELFLAQRAPSRRRRPPINASSMAQYTRQRYFRVLDGVYGYATGQGLLAADPTVGVEDDGHRPRVGKAERRPQVLPPRVLEMLRKPAQLAKLLPMKEERQWWVLRDRVAVALVAHCGLTTAELIALQGRDLRVGTTPYRPGAELALPGLRRQLEVDVREGSAVGRSVPIPDAVVPLLDAWLLARKEQLRACVQPSPAGAAALLLASTQNGAKRTADGTLTPGMLYQVFRKCLRGAYEALHATDSKQHVAAGAAIVRNTVIGDWIDQCGPETAAKLAGLKSLAPWLAARHSLLSELRGQAETFD